MQGPMPHRPGMPLTGWDISPSADGEFLLQRCKRDQKIAGADSPCQGEMSRSDRGGRDCGFLERPAANALALQKPLFPGPPILRGEPEGA